jgi:hypothetical protein
MDFGARLRSPGSWPWRLVLILMVLRYLQGKNEENFRELILCFFFVK